MKMQRVRLQDGDCFSYEDVKSKYVQDILKEAYVLNEKARAYCCCQDDASGSSGDLKSDLELVIAYRRKSELFELRKMPGQSSKLHAEHCLFSRKPADAVLPVTDKTHGENFYITLPSKENGYFADHSGLKKLLNHLLKTVRSEIDVRSWSHLKSELMDLSLHTQLNSDYLRKSFNILSPAPKELLKPIWFKDSEPRVLFGEVLYARHVPNRNTMVIQIKGASDPVWFNSPSFLESDIKALEAINPDKRVIVMCSVLKSSGHSIQGYGLTTKTINKDFN